MLKKVLLVLVLGLIFSTQAYSQSFLIGPQVGYYKAKDADEGDFLFGGAARLKFSSLGVEASINYRQEKYADGAVKVTTYPVMLSGMLYVLPVAYGVAGIGWYNYKYEAFGMEESGSDIGYHIGGGAEISLGSIVLSGDIRYVFLKYQFEDSGMGDQEANFYVITGSVLFPL
ncbi:outer membrane beta-barrel protein [Bacteroidota bacterium]